MTADVLQDFVIREALPDEVDAIDRMTVDVYVALPGMPTLEEQPEHYGLLRDVAKRAANPAIRVLVAVDDANEMPGCVDFIEDVKHYGSGGTVGTIENAAGTRLLGRSRLVLHTTRAMPTAWKMYERMGLRRVPEIDFLQGQREVFGFSYGLDVEPAPLRSTTGRRYTS